MKIIVRSTSDLLLSERSRLTNQTPLQLDLLFVMLEQEPRLKLLAEMETQLLVILERFDTYASKFTLHAKKEPYVDLIRSFLLSNFKLDQNVLNQWIGAGSPPQALNHCLLERDHLLDDHRRCTIVDRQDALLLNNGQITLTIVAARKSILTVVSSSNTERRC